VIFSGDITLRILLINPFKDYGVAVFSQQDALFFSAPHQSLTVRRQNEKRALHAKKYFVERLCDVDDCTLGPLVNEFVFAKWRAGCFGFSILGKIQDT
jgi:hypothetical protein